MTLRTNSAYNGEVLPGALSQGWRSERRIIPWEVVPRDVAQALSHGIDPVSTGFTAHGAVMKISLQQNNADEV